MKIKYQIANDYCPCCKREFEDQQLSHLKEYELTDKAIEEYGDWKDMFESVDDQFGYAEELISDELNFHVLTRGYPKVSEIEIKKVVAYIKDKYQI